MEGPSAPRSALSDEFGGELPAKNVKFAPATLLERTRSRRAA
jgi:hypothetical protein